MTIKRSPRIARWLLEHVVPAQSWSESLSGDLAEQFDRRSRAWYWRQVAGAFVTGWAKDIYRLRFGIVFALLCAFPEPLLWFEYARAASFRELFVWSVMLPWPWSFVFQLFMMIVQNLLLIWAGYALYLVLEGLLDRPVAFRRAIRGLLTAAWVYVLAQVVVVFIGSSMVSFMTFAPINIKAADTLSLLLVPGFVLLRIPTILAMVFAIRRAIPVTARLGNRAIAS